MYFNLPQVARCVDIFEEPRRENEADHADPTSGLREIRYRLPQPKVVFRRLEQENFISIEFTADPR